MTSISSVTSPVQRSSSPRTQAAPPAETGGDRVELNSGGPRLMTGVPTGYLSPEIVPPSLYTPSVGIEIAPGLGISLDGKALLVGQKGTTEELDIIGHLPGQEGGPPVLYPQRDFHVSHQGNSTTVDGYFGWQDYSLTRSGSSVTVVGDEALHSFTTQERADGFDVNSQFTGRTWHVNQEVNSADVSCGYPDGLHFHVTQNGNQTVVDSGHPEINFTLTRNDDGSIFVDGALKPQDFTIKNTAAGLDIQGHYAQQHFVVKA